MIWHCYQTIHHRLITFVDSASGKGIVQKTLCLFTTCHQHQARCAHIQSVNNASIRIAFLDS